MTPYRSLPLALRGAGFALLLAAAAAGAQAPPADDRRGPLGDGPGRRAGRLAGRPAGGLPGHPLRRREEPGQQRSLAGAGRRLGASPGSSPSRRGATPPRSGAPPAGGIAFLAKRGDGPPQLHLLPLDGGEAQAVTDLPVAPQAPRYSPDGKRLYFVAETFAGPRWRLGGGQEAARRRQGRQDPGQGGRDPRLPLLGPLPRRRHRARTCSRLELATGVVTDLTPDLDLLWGFEGPEWDLAPDGREAVFVANSTAPPYATLNFDLFALPLGADGLAAGAPRNLTADNPADDGSPRYSPDGRYLVYVAPAPPRGRPRLRAAGAARPQERLDRRARAGLGRRRRRSPASPPTAACW